MPVSATLCRIDVVLRDILRQFALKRIMLGKYFRSHVPALSDRIACSRDNMRSIVNVRHTQVKIVQENLHLALARLAEAAREQANSVTSQSSAAEILHAPKGGAPPTRYYGTAIRKV